MRTGILICLMSLLLLCGCAKEVDPAEPAPPIAAESGQGIAKENAVTILPEEVPLVQGFDSGFPTANASGEATAQCEDAIIDYSHTEDGYVMVRFLSATDRRLKVLVKGPTTTYNYNLVPKQWTVFPLSDGNGDYQIGIYKNIEGSRYSTVMTATFQVQLVDEFAPFLRPNQYVDYSIGSKTVATGFDITENIEDPLMKVAAVYNYVVSHLEYDIQKAQTVQSGYLPVLDQVLEEGKGICFDYAAVMTARLRSQQIPCKLVVGYAGTVYHAWISVWTEESGWIDGAIFFDGHVWHRMDPTFASSSGSDAQILEFIQNGNYSAKFLY